MSQKLNLNEEVLQFLQEVMEAVETLQLGILVGKPEMIMGKLYVNTSTGGKNALIPYVQSPMLEAPEIGDDVIIMNDKVVGLYKKAIVPQFIPSTKWTDIIGLDEQIAEVREAIRHAEDVSGILLYGEPGNGKTLIAKAIANELMHNLNHPHAFSYIKGGDVLSRYVGDAEQAISRMYKNARQFTMETHKRAVLFIDEAEAILGDRKHAPGYMQSVVTTFLAESDGFDENPPLLILSTNHPRVLDPAITRSGRIDLQIHVRPPNQYGFKDQLIHYGIPTAIAQEVAKQTFLAKNMVISSSLSANMAKIFKRKGIHSDNILKVIDLCKSN